VVVGVSRIAMVCLSQLHPYITTYVV